MQLAIALALTLLLTPAEAGVSQPGGLPAVESLAPSDDSASLDVIWYEVMIWGTIRYTWRIERGGEGRLRRVNQPEQVFAVTAEEFDRIHAMMRYRTLFSRPARRCRPGPTDGPYGAVHWRIRGVQNNLSWSSAYSCSNAEFIYSRLEAADAALLELANGQR